MIELNDEFEWDEISSIDFVDNEDVYDLSVNDTHNFIANDLVVHNCSEIPLSPYDSCRLMVINLVSFVKSPFSEKAYFDYDEFFDVAKKAQKLMDDLVDLEAESVDGIIAKIENDPEPIEVKQIELNLWHKIKEATLNGRRTGLGITGLGDALAYLNVHYGGEHSINITEKIYKTLAMGAYESSCEMARDRGEFPIYDAKKEEDHKFLQQIWSSLSPTAQKLWNSYGRRNIALLTTAPVGSISCLTQTTSGIEPAYMLEYMRRRKMTETDEGQPDFVDAQGIRWQHYNVYHHGVDKWMQITGKHDIKDSPYWGSTAKEINWHQSVKIQAAAQKWVCHGISKTCNLPNDVSKEVVSNAYLEAWRSGCKGFTVYREGSRDGVLVSMDETLKTSEMPREQLGFKMHSAPKRPEILNCEIHHANIKGDKWTMLVGLLDGRPYEILGGLAEFVEIPSKYSTGEIIKRSRKTRNSIYDLSFGENGNEVVVKDVVSVFDNPNHAGFTRVISLALRHGAPLHYIVEQLQKDKDSDLFSFAKVVARVLKKYIDDGTKPGGHADCPECGSEDSLSYTEGCVMCRTCSWGLC